MHKYYLVDAIDYDFANRLFYGDYKSISVKKNETSEEENNNRELFVKQLVPVVQVDHLENQEYKFTIMLNSCPNNSIVNLGIRTTMFSNSSAFILPFNYYPNSSSIITMIKQETIYKNCLMDINSKGNFYSCFLSIGFAKLDDSVAYGILAGPSMNFRFSLQESLSNEVYLYNLNDEKNCNCTLSQDLNIETEICSDINCQENLNPDSMKLNQTIFIKSTILDDSLRNKYYFIPKVVDICINKTEVDYKIKQSACINFKNYTEIISNSPGKIILKITTSIIGSISVHAIYLLSSERKLQDLSEKSQGVLINFKMNVTDSTCTGIFCRENMTLIIFFSIIGIIVLFLTILGIYFCLKMLSKTNDPTNIDEIDQIINTQPLQLNGVQIGIINDIHEEKKLGPSVEQDDIRNILNHVENANLENVENIEYLIHEEKKEINNIHHPRTTSISNLQDNLECEVPEEKNTNISSRVNGDLESSKENDIADERNSNETSPRLSGPASLRPSLQSG